MAVRVKLSVLDRVTLAYLVALGVALAWLWRDGLPANWYWVVIAHVLLAGIALLAPRGRETSSVGRFLSDWYPLIVLPALYSAVGIINLEEAHAYDPFVQRLEGWVFGSQVSYRWIREQPNPLLSGTLHMCYLSYYGILYASPVGLWLSRRRDAARRAILAIMVTFYVCYLVFILLPVTGPRYMFPLADNAATDAAPALLVRWILDRGDAWGAAFPSSHVAASVVAAGMALRGWRPLGLVLALFATGLTIATVYGQFHYAVDALGGLAMAALVLAVGARPAAVSVQVRDDARDLGLREPARGM